MSALNTVRSAPVSTRNRACTQDPVPARTSPRSTGRSTPSAHRCHSPLKSIDAGHLLPGNVDSEAAVVLGMGRLRQGDYIVRRIGAEQFFARNTDDLAAVRFVYVGDVRLQPGPVA